nr:hypothetical protein [Citrobacter sp. ku-bf4]
MDADDNQRGVWFSCRYGQWNVLLSRKVKKSSNRVLES